MNFLLARPITRSLSSRLRGRKRPGDLAPGVGNRAKIKPLTWDNDEIAGRSMFGSFHFTTGL
jgi:hypothetical protein